MTVPPKIILVRPKNPANIGFTARLLKNYGLQRWTLVRGPSLPGSEAERTGAPAREILEKVEHADTLVDALRDCTHAFGLSARRGKHRRSLPVSHLAHLQREARDTSWRPALVFGSEDRGLETDEVEQCGELLYIPTSGLASFNLSHAVAITLHEWSRTDADPDPTTAPIRFATDAEKTRLFDSACAALETHRFPFPHPHFEGAMRRLRALPIEARDLRVLEKIVRHAAWLTESASAKDRPPPPG